MINLRNIILESLEKPFYHIEDTEPTHPLLDAHLATRKIEDSFSNPLYGQYFGMTDHEHMKHSKISLAGYPFEGWQSHRHLGSINYDTHSEAKNVIEHMRDSLNKMSIENKAPHFKVEHIHSFYYPKRTTLVHISNGIKHVGISHHIEYIPPSEHFNNSNWNLSTFVYNKNGIIPDNMSFKQLYDAS